MVGIVYSRSGRRNRLEQLQPLLDGHIASPCRTSHGKERSNPANGADIPACGARPGGTRFEGRSGAKKTELPCAIAGIEGGRGSKHTSDRPSGIGSEDTADTLPADWLRCGTCKQNAVMTASQVLDCSIVQSPPNATIRRPCIGAQIKQSPPNQTLESASQNSVAQKGKKEPIFDSNHYKFD